MDKANPFFLQSSTSLLENTVIIIPISQIGLYQDRMVVCEKLAKARFKIVSKNLCLYFDVIFVNANEGYPFQSNTLS